MKRFVVLILIVCCLLAACGGVVEASVSDGAVTFTDALGRTVAVENPQRVAALLGSFADVWMLSGKSSRNLT